VLEFNLQHESHLSGDAMSTDFSPEVNRLIAEELAHGRYSSQDELLVEAVRLLGERDELRDHINAGDRQLAAGEFTDYDPPALRRRFDELKAGQSFRPTKDS
jgi:Arc/MetJ-type ribon-helix-helix transcriptional regulator